MKHSQSLASAFRNAFNGLFNFFRRERNGQIQAATGFVIVVVSVIFKISMVEWIAVLLCIGLVLSLEMMNSALEKLCDLVHDSYHPVIKTVKDVAAAAVLWASIVSAVIGLVIFLPRIIELL